MIYRDITLLSATIAELYIPGTLNMDPRNYKKDKRKELLYYVNLIRACMNFDHQVIFSFIS